MGGAFVGFFFLFPSHTFFRSVSAILFIPLVQVIHMMLFASSNLYLSPFLCSWIN